MPANREKGMSLIGCFIGRINPDRFGCT